MRESTVNRGVASRTSASTVTSRTYPIMLLHGIARFDELTDRVINWDRDQSHDDLHYFRNIRSHLQAHGLSVWHSRVEWAAPVTRRAQSLRVNLLRVLKKTKAPKVHLIAHSSGGLDARQMLFDGRHEGLPERVASLTTLGTPHHGSPAADLLATVIKKTGKIVGIDASGILDLTTAACARFNSKLRSSEAKLNVEFRTYAGAQRIESVFAPLKALWAIINAVEGPNDGLVAVRSAAWKEEYFVGPVLDADHLNLIGWWDPAELWHGRSPFQLESRIKKLYLSIALDLAKRFPTQ